MARSRDVACDDQSLKVVIGSWTPIAYIASVMKTVRCLLAALLLLVFGGGMALAEIDGGDTMQPAAEASVDQPMPGDCNDCGNDNAMTTTACFAFGTCMQAVNSLVANTLPRPESVVYTAVTEHITGFKGSPEPFPPKTSILA